MSKTVEFSPIALLPTSKTGTKVYTMPVFENAFRACEKLVWSLTGLEENLRSHTSQDLEWAMRHDVQRVVDFFEARLELCLASGELKLALPALTREIDNLVRGIDPRNGRATGTEDIDLLLMNTSRLTVMKARALEETAKRLSGSTGELLSLTEEAGQFAQEIVKREYEKCIASTYNGVPPISCNLP